MARASVACSRPIVGMELYFCPNSQVVSDADWGRSRHILGYLNAASVGPLKFDA
jgi:hypothetical protein